MLYCARKQVSGVNRFYASFNHFSSGAPTCIAIIPGECNYRRVSIVKPCLEVERITRAVAKGDGRLDGIQQDGDEPVLLRLGDVEPATWSVPLLEHGLKVRKYVELDKRPSSDKTKTYGTISPFFSKIMWTGLAKR